MLLEPKKGTQGREMNRRARIASRLAVASAAGCLALLAPLSAHAGSPLLSGYGGPGAGEQAIIGSTFLGGSHAGGGSGGGSSGSTGPGSSATGSSTTLSGVGASTRAGAQSGSTAARAGSPGGSISAARRGAGSSQAGGATAAKAGRTGANASVGAGSSAFAYPSALRSTSASPALGLSGGDLALLAGMILALALIGLFTMRLARLQP